MLILCFSGGIIFMLPFLREVYYLPMQEALQFNNTQMGVLMSVFGAFSLLFYFPGGWLADRYSPRKLMTTGLVTTGLAGMLFSTFPSYEISIAVHAFWGITICLTFWSAMIKATRNWAPASEQGRAFGILESGRGVSEVLSSSLILVVFAWLGSSGAALFTVINIFAAINIGLAVLVWIFLSDDLGGADQPGERESAIGVAQILEVLKMPGLWLISLVVLTAYSAYWGTFYFAAYSSEVFMLSVVAGGAVGVGKMWVKPLAALGAGFLGDRFGISRTVLGFLILTTLSFVAFGVLPGGSQNLVAMLIGVGVSSLAVFALRGIYFALLEEGGIKPALTGTAAGIVSAIGFTPDIYMPLLGGVLLDKYPGETGYQYLYLCIAAMCLVGTLCAYLIVRRAHPSSAAPA